MDAELAGGLPQPHLARQGVGGLGQLVVLPVGAGLRERVISESAALGRSGAAEDAVIVVDPASDVQLVPGQPPAPRPAGQQPSSTRRPWLPWLPAPWRCCTRLAGAAVT
jgi:hypothetical protein